MIDNNKIVKPKGFYYSGKLEFRTLILYLIPIRRLMPHIPAIFDIPEFKIEHKKYGIIGIEHLENTNFHSNFSFGLKSNFSQTNYLAFVEHKSTHKKGYFYWGGTNSNRLNYITSSFKQNPWYKANYKSDSVKSNDFYKTLTLNAKASQLQLILELADLNKEPESILPFSSHNNFLQCIQNPDFYSFENKHEDKLHFFNIYKTESAITQASVKKINSEVLQNLCLATNEEIQKPLSAYIFGSSNYYLKFGKTESLL